MIIHIEKIIADQDTGQKIVLIEETDLGAGVAAQDSDVQTAVSSFNSNPINTSTLNLSPTQNVTA
jgi:hypothetical protein